MICPKCGSKKISEVPNTTLDVVAKCDMCGYEDFVKKFDEDIDDDIKIKKLAKAFEIAEKIYFDEWNFIYAKAEELYMNKYLIVDNKALSYVDRRKIAATAAEIREQLSYEKRNKNTEVIRLILEERTMQDEKYGTQSHKPEVWLSIITEEMGEMAEAINETMFDNGAEKKKLGGIENIQKELVQILAVGFAMYMDLKNKQEKKI